MPYYITSKAKWKLKGFALFHKTSDNDQQTKKRLSAYWFFKFPVRKHIKKFSLVTYPEP